MKTQTPDFFLEYILLGKADIHKNNFVQPELSIR